MDDEEQQIQDGDEMRDESDMDEEILKQIEEQEAAKIRADDIIAKAKAPISQNSGPSIGNASILEELNQLWNKWFPDWPDPSTPNPNQHMTPEKTASEVVRIFKITEDQLKDKALLDAQVDLSCRDIASTLSELQQYGLMSDELVSKKMRLIVDKAIAAKYMIQSIAKFKEADAGEIQMSPGGLALYRFLDISTVAKPNAIQQILIQTLAEVARLGYRRYNGDFWEPVKNSKNQFTCAWKRVMPIEDFLWDHTKDTSNGDNMWYLLTKNPANLRNVRDILSKSQERQVMQIVPDRHTFSFDNGVYLAKDDVFIQYERLALKSSQHTFPVAAKHFKTEFNQGWATCADYNSIPTPGLDQILNYQAISPEMKRWTLGLIGRLLYNVGEMDDWQVMLFIKGLANTGKSRILLDTVAQFYDETQIGIVSNNMEKQFGLSNLIDKFIVVMDDIRENFTMDQSDFQNVVSGLRVSLAVKYGKPRVEQWKAPFISSGNEPINYRDNSGSFSRRLFVLYFNKIVDSPDSSLIERLHAEIGAVICKCNRAYKDLLMELKTDGIWKHAPREALAEKKNLAASTNFLTSFLDSGDLVYGPEYTMPMSIFRKRMNEHAEKNGFPRTPFKVTFYEGPFNIHKIKLIYGSNKKRIYHGDPISESSWIVGCDLIESQDLAVGDVGASTSASAVTNAADVFIPPK